MADDNLDAHLFPKDSPYNTREPYVPAYDFDVTHQIPAGGINYTNLTAASRAATAVISLSGEKGTFKDIQAAINYVNSLGGGRILVLPGTYVITQNITIYRDISLEGLVTADCILDFNSTTNNISTETDATDIAIIGLTIKNCQNITTGAIFIASADRVRVERCIFTNNKNGSNVGCDIYNFRGNTIIVDQCDSTDDATFYYSEHSARANAVTNNAILNPYGITFDGTGSGIGATLFMNNYVSGAKASIFSGQFPGSRIVNNALSGGSDLTDPLIKIGVVGTGSGNVRITNNNIFSSTTGAMELINTFQSQIVGNTLESNKTSTPTILLTNTHDLTLSSNFINANSSGTSQDGIKLDGNSDENVITGNWIRGSENGGTSYGVNISAATCNSNVVVGNVLRGLTADTQDSGTGSVIANNA